MQIFCSLSCWKKVRGALVVPVFWAATVLYTPNATAQLAAGYQVATWQGFKAAAVTYTFDDNTSKQLSVAVPLFNQYNFKTTLFTVTNWGPNWSALRAAVQNGHEVASHTVSHPSLNSLSVSAQDTELRQSQAVIRNNIPEESSVTVAYPNCNVSDLATTQKYYIAGRVCSGRIEPSTPANFYQISSLIAGSQGSVKTATDFNNQVNSAKSSNGWAVFLMHGIDNDGGYSPLASSVLADHLSYMNANKGDFWVATFANVVKYVKERNALRIEEAPITKDSLQVIIQDNLEDELYNVPVTVRRQLPVGWSGARVYVSRSLVSSTVVAVGNILYVQFDVLPGNREVHIANSAVVAGVDALQDLFGVTVGPNPFLKSFMLKASGSFNYALYHLNGKLVEQGEATDVVQVGASAAVGAYLLKVRYKGQTGILRVIKAN